MEKAIVELRKKQRENSPEVVKNTHLDECKVYKEEVKIPKLRVASVLTQTVQENLTAKITKKTHVRNQSNSEILEKPEVSPVHVRVKSVSPVPVEIMSPLPRLKNDTSHVQQLAALPLFRNERYTHKRPKRQASNPITMM